MPVNKVEYFGRTLLDLSADTASPAALLRGETAHNAAGQRITGTLVPGDMFKSEYGGSAAGVVAQADKAKEAAGAQTANTLLERTGGQGHAGDWYAPPGAVIAFAGKTAPAGWLLCNGSAVSRSSYKALFAAIGTTYGAGNGSSTFNLPDLRGRVPAGAGTAALASKAGADTKTIARANLPNEKLKIQDNGAWLVDTARAGVHSGKPVNLGGSRTGAEYLYTEPLGSGQAFDVRQATIYLNYIIKT